jgi:competence protein ComGC
MTRKKGHPMNQPPPVPPAPAPPKNSALAIWSLILGILSITCLWVVSAIPAVICGHLAQSRIKASAGRLTGSGLALAGLITGYLSIALSVVVIPMMLAVAIPNFVKARSHAQKNMCINNLRQIDAAKQQWALEKKKEQIETPTQADLDEYLKPGSSLTCPAGGTYTINAVGEKPTCSVSDHVLP